MVVLTQICLCLRYGSFKLLGAVIVVDRAQWEMAMLFTSFKILRDFSEELSTENERELIKL